MHRTCATQLTGTRHSARELAPRLWWPPWPSPRRTTRTSWRTRPPSKCSRAVLARRERCRDPMGTGARRPSRSAPQSAPGRARRLLHAQRRCPHARSRRGKPTAGSWIRRWAPWRRSRPRSISRRALRRSHFPPALGQCPPQQQALSARQAPATWWFPGFAETRLESPCSAGDARCRPSTLQSRHSARRRHREAWPSIWRGRVGQLLRQWAPEASDTGRTCRLVETGQGPALRAARSSCC